MSRLLDQLATWQGGFDGEDQDPPSSPAIDLARRMVEQEIVDDSWHMVPDADRGIVFSRGGERHHLWADGDKVEAEYILLDGGKVVVRRVVEVA